MEFWLISRPEVATPPALAALAGAKSTPCSWRYAVASRVVGMLAPSATAKQPCSTRALAPSRGSSFWVAQGRAMPQGTVQMPWQPSTYLAVGT